MPVEPTREAGQSLSSDAADIPTMTMLQARMLDLRIYISGLFLIFGATVTVMGISPSQAQLERAAGVNINLWAGLAMLGLSLVMGVWAYASPPELPTRSSSDPNMPDLL